MANVDDPTPEQRETCPDPPKLDHVSLREVELTGDDLPDRVVDVAYDGVCGEDMKSPGGVSPGRGRRVGVLATVRPGLYCIVQPQDDVLSLDQGRGSVACLGPDLGADAPLVVSFEPLVARGRSAIRVVRSGGMCDTCGRAGHYETFFLDVRGAVATTVFSSTTFDVGYSGCPWPPTRVEQATVEVVGATFPRSIALTEATDCPEPPDGMPQDLVEECTPSKRASSWVWNGKVYARQ
jgi:hypothetical protein